jgi:hypothetical protein
VVSWVRFDQLPWKYKFRVLPLSDLHGNNIVKIKESALYQASGTILRPWWGVMVAGNGTWALHLFSSSGYVNIIKGFVIRKVLSKLTGWLRDLTGGTGHRQAWQKWKIEGRSTHRTNFLDLSTGSGTSSTQHVVLIIQSLPSFWTSSIIRNSKY